MLRGFVPTLPQLCLSSFSRKFCQVESEFLESKEDDLPMSKLPWAGQRGGLSSGRVSQGHWSGSVSTAAHLPCGYGEDNLPQSPRLDNGVNSG